MAERTEDWMGNDWSELCSQIDVRQAAGHADRYCRWNTADGVRGVDSERDWYRPAMYRVYFAPDDFEPMTWDAPEAPASLSQRMRDAWGVLRGNRSVR